MYKEDGKVVVESRYAPDMKKMSTKTHKTLQRRKDVKIDMNTLRKEVRGMMKNQYCGWQHDPTGIEKNICEECEAVNKALQDVISRLK